MEHRVEPGADRTPTSGRFPDDGSMRISHEAIYQALYIQDRGALKRELVTSASGLRLIRERRPAVSRAAATSHQPVSGLLRNCRCRSFVLGVANGSLVGL